MTRAVRQVRTSNTTTYAVMKSAGFRRGFEQARAGQPPQFDSTCDAWNYERGRLFAYIAPLAMSLWTGRTLNPKAIALFQAAYHRKWVL
jgi:hypothetical protein